MYQIYHVKKNKMKAQVKTKSNFKNLNFQWLEVAEILGRRVSCFYFDHELNKKITIDNNKSNKIETGEK